jgi:predicted ATP-grasp superfamily ATP-dependent carboligase
MIAPSNNTDRTRAESSMPPASTESPNPSSARSCVVVGASVRAFAESAARRGWRVHAADLFGDVDLAAVASTVVRLGPAGAAAYPAGIPDLVSALPDGPCVYTGAIENHPDVIAEVAARRPLAGCSVHAVRVVRDPARLAALVRAAGHRFPDTTASPEGVPTDGSFLVKPERSAGGHGIRAWHGGPTASEGGARVWQRRVAGDHWSAHFLARGQRASLVGTSRPLAPARWCGGRGFSYCGSVDAPLAHVADDLRRRLESLGASLAANVRLEGLFGIDTIVDAAGHLHVLEVNPRPTASMELVERATGWSVAAAHLAACGWGDPPAPPSDATVVWAKAIVFAHRPLHTAPADDVLAAFATSWTTHDGKPAMADLPSPAAWPITGGPLVTVFASGESHADAVASLRRRVLTLRRAVAAAFSPRAASAS